MNSLLKLGISTVIIASSAVIISTPDRAALRVFNCPNKIEAYGKTKTNGGKAKTMCHGNSEDFVLNALWQNLWSLTQWQFVAYMPTSPLLLLQPARGRSMHNILTA